MEKADVLEVTVQFLNDFIAARQFGCAPPTYPPVNTSPTQQPITTVNQNPIHANQVMTSQYSQHHFLDQLKFQHVSGFQHNLPITSGNILEASEPHTRRAALSYQCSFEQFEGDSEPEVRDFESDESSRSTSTVLSDISSSTNLSHKEMHRNPNAQKKRLRSESVWRPF